MSCRTLLCGFLTAMFLMEMTPKINALNVLPYLAEKILPYDVTPYQNNVIMDENGKAFSAALQEMDKAVLAKLNNESCNGFRPQKPNFRVEGRRISEIKCLDYIWDIKIDEGEQHLFSQCPGLSGIVGGETSEPGKYPHMGAIGWKNIEKGNWSFRCGSSLISELFVMTAAHCEFDENRKHPDIVRFGVVNIADEELITSGVGMDRKILKFIRHPRYMPNYKNYDIAVIKLAKKVRFSKYIQPACILNQQYINKAIITGWGSISEEQGKAGIISNDLQVAKVDMLPPKECRRRWRGKREKQYWLSYFVKEQICATKHEGVADICAGDSGGPLQTQLHVNTDMPIHNIIGITAFNYECGSHNFPSVYTKVNFHLDWIEKHVWGVEHIGSSSKTTEKPKRKTGVKIDEIQRFDSGYLFWYQTNQGSEWNYIAASELARIRQENEINTNNIDTNS